jgi:hypothetical protein
MMRYVHFIRAVTLTTSIIYQTIDLHVIARCYIIVVRKIISMLLFLRIFYFGDIE